MKMLLIIICFVLFSDYGKTQFGPIIKGVSKVIPKLKPIPKRNWVPKLDWKDLIDKDLIEKALEDYDDEKKNFQNTTKLNTSHNFKGIELDSKFNNKKRLVRDYRKWANSTDELSHKFGKPSNYDLDANGTVNNYFYRSYAAGKKEFHKTHPLKNYDLEEKDLITIHDMIGQYTPKDNTHLFGENTGIKNLSEILASNKNADLLSNQQKTKTSHHYQKDLFYSFLKSNSSFEFEDPQNTMDLNTKYDKRIIWKLTPGNKRKSY